ncbi:acetyl-CoA C-acetyltransferase [Halogranum amylolyticum]|uniref:acetyl-CoA C-acyltransferase n=1 Tax=Halogranum amylolyticum TaxID=660520 RepID=A0A1H8WQQ6_9EURY|nr:thiolase family protein [Halogranum amylolyticum]SEP30020.1 acetyl-CoA C-acetyltransferase [Halogranum amylolyticum]
MTGNSANAVVVDAVRTPQARNDGALSEAYPEDLVVAVLDALVERTGVDPSEWVDFRLGCANQENDQGRNLARQCLLAGGFPETVPGGTLNRLCGSSLTALNDVARAIEAGDGAVYPIAGVEHMTRVPFSDWLHPSIEDRYDAERLSMGQTAETIARRHDISRTEQDEFALRSHERAVEARNAGRFDDELVSVELDGELIETDETPRPGTTLEKLADLPTVFRSDNDATVTPGNASPLTDGAAGLLVTSEAYAEEHGLDPLARIHSRSVVGVDPEVMGRGPIPATRNLLESTDYTVEDLDLVELNEAFASQSLHCKRELGFPDDKLNVNGGAIALGHPLGCSGARITTTLLHELNRRDGDLGLATMCVGFGQGVATLFERL